MGWIERRLNDVFSIHINSVGEAFVDFVGVEQPSEALEMGKEDTFSDHYTKAIPEWTLSRKPQGPRRPTPSVAGPEAIRRDTHLGMRIYPTSQRVPASDSSNPYL